MALGKMLKVDDEKPLHMQNLLTQPSDHKPNLKIQALEYNASN